MAESQVPYPYTEDNHSIISSLSEARFAPYLKNAGFNQHYAFSLYLYNARLSKAFLYPLHILEVTLRNRIDQRARRISLERENVSSVNCIASLVNSRPL